MNTYNEYFSIVIYRQFDKILRVSEDDNCIQREVKKVLAEKVVNPLRNDFYVPHENVMILRELLDKNSTVSGLTHSEKGAYEI